MRVNKSLSPSSQKIKILHIIDSLSVDGKTVLLFEFVKNLGKIFDNKILTLKWGGPRQDLFENLDAEVIVCGMNRMFLAYITRRVRIN